ncbi:MAG: DNA replication/repair protein RecF [Opitutales bacterium]|nr:DNA replication/repair protein RecF [Opitutales bacterium]
MFIQDVSVEQFRNISLGRVEFGDVQRTFLVGKNGQGKSNLLEAVGMVSAVRSFRTHEIQPLIRHEESNAGIFYRIEEADGEKVEVELELSVKKRKIQVDGETVGRLSDYVGRYPTVVFSADDTQLIRVGPQVRRRYFDMILSMLEGHYLDVLQSYHRALRERNRALKTADAKRVVEAYDPVLAKYGVGVVTMRKHWTGKMIPYFKERYRQIATDKEEGIFSYQTKQEEISQEEFLEELKRHQERDVVLGSTTFGPHRDDYEFSVFGKKARHFSSDGQMRSFVLALKLAQLDLLKSVNKSRPVLLMDDILGELDATRRERFWEALDPDCQVIASGTVFPENEVQKNWRVYSVDSGSFSLQE